MAIKWTDQQNKALEVRGHNTLVSAAAGSGKTTVLVERVIRMVTDADNPVSLDELLIVTFTKAAAQQMKEKIRAAISKKLKEDPESEHLRRQFIAVDTAKISTFDALCRQILSENFQETDIDPAIKTANEQDLAVLSDRVMDETLEEFYEAEDPDFLDLIDRYMDRDDENVAEMAAKLYKFARSHPWPKEWLSMCAGIYKADCVTEASWFKEIEAYADNVIEGCLSDANNIITVLDSRGGPAKCLDVIEDDARIFTSLKEADFNGRMSILNPDEGSLFLRFSWAKDKSEEGALLKERVKEIRDEYKKRILKLREDIYFKSLEKIISDMKGCAKTAETLLKVTERFMDKFLSEKLRQGVADFTDIAHFALDTLIKRKDGVNEYTESARRMASGLKEIIIDEYQDTNELEEELIRALSGSAIGRTDNIFMVGDVKQSIYRFRQANPDLFNEKYNTYKGDARVILGENFRSRENIIDFVNRIFSKVMIPEVGGIDYSDENELKYGAKDFYTDPPSDQDERVEVTFIGAKAKDGRIAASSLIAKKIEELVGAFMVQDSDDEGRAYFRPAKYSDIAILSRNTNNPELEKTLQRRGIPVEKSTSEGFFGSLEIKLALSLLSVISNPYQDIEFAAVLHSPLVGLSASELAELKLRGRDGGFCPTSTSEGADEASCSLYEIALRVVSERVTNDAGFVVSPYQGKAAFNDGTLSSQLAAFPDKGRGTAVGGGGVCQVGQNPLSTSLSAALYRKISGFMALLNDFRGRTAYMDLYDLVEYIFTESGLYNIVCAMPEGDVRLSNLLRFRSMAGAFAENNRAGLFAFILNLRRLLTLGHDEGQSGSEAGNCVRMMTIHKSKGLEFPIVVLAGAGKEFNQSDARDEILINRSFGVGLSFRDPDLKIKEPTLFKQALKKKESAESIAEEARLLYVALTRAKEKLIIFGSDKSLLKEDGSSGTLLSGWKRLNDAGSDSLSADSILKCSSHLKLIGASLFAGSDGTSSYANVFSPPDGSVGSSPSSGSDGTSFKLEIKGAEDIEDERAAEIRNLADIRETLEGMARGAAAALEDFYGIQPDAEANSEIMSGAAAESSTRENSKKYDGNLSKLAAELNFKYPHDEASRTPMKRTASGLEKPLPADDMSDAEFREYSDTVYYDDSDDSALNSAAIARGARRGSAYHRVFELLDYKMLTAINSNIDRINACIPDQIKKMRETGRLSEEFAKLINPEEIAAFTASDLGKRMAAADLRGDLFREKQFVKGDRIIIDGEEETLLMQGAIDAFFIERCESSSHPAEKQVILVDYKTDRGRSPEELIEMYLPQQLEYKDALERALGLPVKEMYLYSTALRRAISLLK